MKFLKLSLALMLMITSNLVSAAIFESGDFQIVASSYIDTTGQEDTIGLGQIQTITQNGLIVWTSGQDGQFLNYSFSDYLTTSSIPVATDTVFFTAVGGLVDFWLNETDVFDISLSWADQVDLFDDGTLYLSAAGSGNTSGINGSTVYSVNGLLDVLGGSELSFFDTDSINPFGNDMSFNISGDNIHTAGTNAQYNFSGSGDLNGVTVVPVPGAIWLLASGMIALTLTPRRKI